MFSSVIFLYVSIFTSINFAQTQIVCPELGLVNVMTQDVTHATKCFFVMKFDSDKTEAENNCKVAGGSSAKIAQPDDPIANEILRMVLNEYLNKNPGLALLGIEISQLDNNEITFITHGKSDTIEYDFSYNYEKRYTQDVGEIGSVKGGTFSYFLQPDSLKLSYLRPTSTETLCVAMNSSLGNWIIMACDERKYMVDGLVLCESQVFTNCKLLDSECTYDENDEVCYQKVSENCPPLIPTEIHCDCDSQPCIHSPWSTWSQPYGDCSSGRHRIRFRLAHTLTDNCKDENMTEKMNERCSGCKVDEWSNWSACSATCGDGFQNRTRKTYHFPNDRSWTDSECEKTGIDERSCNVKDCPQDCVQEISAWSTCTATCGFKGFQNRTIKRIVNATDGGLECAEENRTQNCPNLHCPFDCTYTDWIDGECSTSCDNGKIIRTRNISEEARHNGTCKNMTTTTVECINDPCITNCTLNTSLYMNISQCSATCGMGKQFVKFWTIQEESNWGYCDNPVQFVDCNSGSVCPLDKIDNSVEEQKKGMSKEAVTIIAVSVVTALVVIVIFIGFVVFYVRNSKKSIQTSREAIRQAVKDVLGKNASLKSKRASSRFAPKSPSIGSKSI